ncbi:hypothetical protein ACS0TY_009874 [Phlomoides rotata]
MSEIMKDSAIKLFGKTINLLPDKFVSDDSVSEQRHSSLATSTSQDSKDESLTRSGHEYYESIINPRDEETLTESSEIDDDTNTPNKEEKTLKKPDKILPCPRCNSMETKFCYYNNYNVNQPRYFCKKCQRYWTSGGTMRNVPVGSGRRKNKTTAVPNFHHIMVSDAPLPSGFLISPNAGGYPVTFYPGTPAYWVPSCSLGKHSREESHDAQSQRSILIPKTLRIDDPKSSIWSTLGIKNERSTSGSLSGTGLFKAFESKGAGRRSIHNTAMVLQANPAAFSRSVNFHERA